MQRDGVNFSSSHTYAAVASPNCIRLMLNFCAARNYYIDQIDIGNAYILADLEEPIYMKVPVGLKEYYASIGKPFPPGEVRLFLRKNIYGLKQAGFAFGKLLAKALRSLGFIESTEPCLFIRKEDDGSISMVSCYVDDCCLGFKDHAVMQKFKIDLGNYNEEFSVDDIGPIKHLLGVHIIYDRENGKFTLNQAAYLEKLNVRFDLYTLSPQNTPISKDDALMFSRPALWEEKMRSEGKGYIVDNDQLCDATLNKAVIGSALHATKWTRPDATTAVYYCATAMHRPTVLALNAALKVLKYMHDTKRLCMNYSCQGIEHSFTGYSDSDLAGWHNGRSRTGWCVKFGRPSDKNACLLWNCRLQVPVFDNTPDAEQAALMELGHCMFWARNLADECGFPQTEISDSGELKKRLSYAFCDNKPVVQRTKNPRRLRAKRKIRICYWKGLEYCSPQSDDRIIDLKHVDGESNPADVWTKCTGKKELFRRCRQVIMNLKNEWG